MPASDGLTPDQLQAIEAGCEGVTPGPWTYYDGLRLEVYRAFDPDTGPTVVSEGDKTAAHIARLDPDTVRELVRGYRECSFWEAERNKAALAEVEAREEAERLRATCPHTCSFCREVPSL